MHIRRIIYSKYGKYIISFILGLGFAALFKRACRERNCLKFVAPPIDKIKNQIFKYNDKCYTYKQSAVSCSSHKKIIPFA